MPPQGMGQPAFQQQVVYVPPQNYFAYPVMVIQGSYMNMVEQAKEILKFATAVHIKQEINILEMITGCEQKNRYDIYVRYEGGATKRIFRCKEESDFCMRLCCQ